MNSVAFKALLLDEASAMFRASGSFAYHYARGKLGSDPLFMQLLRLGLLSGEGSIKSPANNDAKPRLRLLDLGCGQGSLFAWLLAAQRLHAQGKWPQDWPEPPGFQHMQGLDLMPKDVLRATQAFGAQHPMVRITQGDMNASAWGQVDVITLLDALHYFDYDKQTQLFARIRAALPPGGLFLTRIGDAAAGWPFRVSQAVDFVTTFMRGHRLARLYCRPLAAWQTLLTQQGFDVRVLPMSQGQPFANTLLICHVRP